MTDLRRAAERALAKLDHLWEIGIDAEYKVELLPEIHALRQALTMENFSEVNQEIEEALKQPKREWVGLTDEEIKEIVGPWGDTPIKGYTRKLFDQIEAKLKEKNGGYETK